MRTRPSLLASGLALGLAGSVLTGCASQTETYCGNLEERQQELSELAVGGGSSAADLDESLGLFEDLREDAPGDVRVDWDTMVFAWEGFAEAFERAGAPVGFDPADPPAGVSAEEAAALEDAAAELGSARVVEAVTGIEQHAKDVCKVDLGGPG